ncbi:MAG TPA: YbhN family protein [Phycisphaeraceae bacterium]
MRRSWIQRARSILGLALVGVCIGLLWRELSRTDLAQAVAAMQRVSAGRLAAAAGITALGHLLIVGYDLLGLRYIRQPMGLRRTLLAGFIGNAVSNVVSLPFIGIAGIRAYFYSGWGVRPADLLRLIAFIGVTAWVGLLATTGAAMAAYPLDVPMLAAAPLQRALGALMLAAVAGCVALGAWRSELNVFRWHIRLPSPAMAVGQVLVGAAEWLTLSTILYTLTPAAARLPVGEFFCGALLVLMLAMLGPTPAGLGVLDAGFLLVFSRSIDRPELVGTLTLLRLIYHLPPLALATALLGGYELWQRTRPTRRSS